MAGRRSQVERVAAAELGLERLRPGQREAVDAVLAGHDTLVVMPTGGGKSAIYEIAGLLKPGLTLVVSPLVALQRDQVGAIEEAEIAGAAELNAGLTEHERAETWEQVEVGEIEFLLLAPEQLVRAETLERLAAIGPSLLVVDEAHSISEWGQDFRPDYLRLAAAAEELGGPTVLALTATAAPTVRREIVDRLQMRDPRVIVKGFDRPNIHLAVEAFANAEHKHEALVEHVVAAEKPGIVYAATRKGAEALAAALAEAGVSAAAYHAGLARRRRDEVQDTFMADELEVVVATIAFGMGIDKPNVRFVFHAEISDSLDSYYQELGRAGRDGEPAHALLFYRPQDVGLRRFFRGVPPVELVDVQTVVERVATLARPLDPRRLLADTGLTKPKLTTILTRLEEQGAVRVLPGGEVERGEHEADVTAVVRRQDERREYERSRVRMMQSYAELRDCRRRFVLNYFGEPREEPCGFCDNCEAGLVVAAVEEPFPVGEAVEHAEWGAGTVQRYEGDKLVVLFESSGYRTLAVDLVVEHALLRPAADLG